MLRIFEAIKKSPFLNGNFLLSSLPANASAEIKADAQQITFFSKICFPLIKHPLRVRHATEDDLSSDEWHLSTFIFPLFSEKE